jgi:hypothetical protein
MALQDIGLGLLKFLSSHRGLTCVSPAQLVPQLSSAALLTPRSHELFDEYTRRQFLSKAPEKNPFGTEQTPARFAHFDVFTKVCWSKPSVEALILIGAPRRSVCCSR